MMMMVGFLIFGLLLFSHLKCHQKGLLVVPSKSLMMVGVLMICGGVVCKCETMGDHVSFNQFPGLMVPGSIDDENSETRSFLRFNPNTGFFEQDEEDSNPSLPIPHGYACKGSAYGWVFLVGDELDTKLMNPFTGEEIQLPSVSTLPQATTNPPWIGINKLYVLKAVFSSDPSLQQPAPIVMVIHRGDTPRLAYCKPGDTSWTSLHPPSIHHIYYDAIFYQDQFYAISQPGYIMAYDIGRRTNDNDHSVRKTLIAPGPRLTKPQGDLYLVVLDGELIKITRNISRDEDPYITVTFKVVEPGPILSGPIISHGVRYVTSGFLIRRFVGGSENRWVKVESLGDHALFLGKHTSFSLRASQHPGCIPNAIYFTDCSLSQNQESGSDMGVYKLSDGSVTPLYPVGSGSTLPPPVMVTRVPSADSSYAARGGDFCTSQSLVKRDIFRLADIPILFSGWQSLGDDNVESDNVLLSQTWNL